MTMLGGALLGQKQYAQAEALLLAGYQGMKERAAQIPPQGKVRLTEAESRLVELFEATRKKDETRFAGRLTVTRAEVAHAVKLTAGNPVIIEMRSEWFDTYLRLEDAKGKLIAENDDIDTASKNLDSRILFVPQADGIYRVIATSYQRQGRGDYTLAVGVYHATKPK